MATAAFASDPAAAGQVAGSSQSADARFSAFDAAVRANRGAMLNSGGNECASAKIGSAPPVGIGNVYTQGGATGPIVNQTEIHNSTIIIQNN